MKELAKVEEAVALLALRYPGTHIQILTDNMATVHWIQKWTARSTMAAVILKNMASLAVKWDVSIECLHIPGHHNDIADAISRLHAPGQLFRLSSLLRTFHQGPHPLYFTPYHT